MADPIPAGNEKARDAAAARGLAALPPLAETEQGGPPAPEAQAAPPLVSEADQAIARNAIACLALLPVPFLVGRGLLDGIALTLESTVDELCADYAGALAPKIAGVSGIKRLALGLVSTLAQRALRKTIDELRAAQAARKAELAKPPPVMGGL